MRGTHLLILLVVGFLLWQLAPSNPITVRGLVMGLGYLFMGISLYGFASKLEALRKASTSKLELEGETRVYAPVTCSECGAPNHPSAESCERCGAPLRQTKRVRRRKS